LKNLLNLVILHPAGQTLSVEKKIVLDLVLVYLSILVIHMLAVNQSVYPTMTVHVIKLVFKTNAKTHVQEFAESMHSAKLSIIIRLALVTKALQAILYLHVKLFLRSLVRKQMFTILLANGYKFIFSQFTNQQILAFLLHAALIRNAERLTLMQCVHANPTILVCLHLVDLNALLALSVLKTKLVFVKNA
jgi:hypothetical protein